MEEGKGGGEGGGRFVVKDYGGVGTRVERDGGGGGNSGCERKQRFAIRGYWSYAEGGWEEVVEVMRGNGAVRMVIRLKLMGKWSGGEGTQVMGWGGQG